MIKLSRALLVPALFFIGSLTTSSCKSSKEDATVKKNTTTRTLRLEGFLVQAEAFQKDFNASGTLRPNEEISIMPEVAGRITAINFKEGGFVKKGQTLLEINNADILAQIRKLKAQRALQLKMQERQEELLAIGGISRQDYETTQTQIASIDADIAFQEAQLRKTRIIAPFDGRIGLRQVSLGAVVSANTVVATLQQVHPLKMDFSIPDQYRDAVAPGKTVFFKIQGIQESLSGKIAAVDPAADVNTRSITVRAVVPNPGNNLVAGAFAHVHVPFESSNDALLIPSQAIIPTTREKQVVVVRGGKAQMVTVELGTRTEDRVQVLSGIVAGDTVITTGLMQVKPGMDVTITKLNS